MENTVILTVEGMACEKCEQRIIKMISSMSGVELVEACAPKGIVTIVGGDLDAAELTNTVEEMGFTVISAK